MKKDIKVTDIYDLSSLFLGVDKDYLKKLNLPTILFLGSFQNIFKEYFPDEYYSTIKSLFDSLMESIPKEYFLIFYKNFLKEVGGEKELAKMILQIGTSDEYSGVVKYEDGEVSLSRSDANSARKSLSSSLFSAFYSTIFSSKSEREAVWSKLVQFPIKGGRITSEIWK